MSDTHTLLSLDGVSHKYVDDYAVEHVSFRLEEGDFLSLLGPSGCGKTTILRLIAGFESLNSGSISINNQVMSDLYKIEAPEYRHLGMVFQDFALFPHLRVTENIGYGLKDVSRAEREETIAELLDFMELAKHADKYPHMLSGGEQQRVALARAIAPKPSILLLDEPFSNLDSRLRDRIRDNLLHQLHKFYSAAILVTHDSEEAMYLSNRIGLLRAGKIVQIGAPEQLYFNPVNSFAMQFFGDTNVIPGVSRNGLVITPLGEMPAKDLEDGAQVAVYIRPEGLKLTSQITENAPVLGEVLAARLLGRASLVHLQVPRDEGDNLHLHARIAGHFLPEAGSHMALSF
ncbi:MAG: ABC transporter ATP-binding protein, partial [Pseudomonadota bacterium]